MRRIKPIAGLLVLCGLCFCAFGASNASAMTAHECVSPAEGTGAKYTSATCETESGTGTFQTKPLPAGTSVPVTPTLTETTSTGTTGEEPGVHAVLHVVVGGISFQITCTGLTSSNSQITNQATSPMRVTGSGTWKLTGCSIKTPTQCSVPTELTFQPMTQTETEVGEKMSLVFKPTTGETFITLPVSGASCPAAIKGEKVLTGEFVGTVSTTKPASLTFNSASGNNIKFGGVAGAQFTATIHFKRNSNGALIGFETPS